MKSTQEVSHLDNLQETFNTLRLYNMKLNPSKCVFSVVSGKFLGFMVSLRRVEANPDKVQAIMEIAPPRATDKCLPFFKVLRKVFEWIDECQGAFEELKTYLTSPPLLSPSKSGEKLSHSPLGQRAS